MPAKNFLRNDILRLVEKILSRDILRPGAAAVVADDPGPFYEFIRAKQEIHPQHRQLQHKGNKKAEGHRITPHVDGIADQAETGIAACTEHTGNQRGIDGCAHDVIGIDLTESMIQKADEIADMLDYNIDFRVMNAQELDFDDEEFDVVISRNLTWTLPDIEQAYKEWYRVLKKDGVLLNFDADYGKVCLEEEMKSLGEEHSHNMMDKSMVNECDAIKQELEISKRRRPMWDEEFLKDIGFGACKTDCEISGRVYKIKDDFYNPTPMFKVCAIKSR